MNQLTRNSQKTIDGSDPEINDAGNRVFWPYRTTWGFFAEGLL